jgi:4-amino-4-deoxy-L-arabinose transferase-like glycosyltransferase
MEKLKYVWLIATVLLALVLRVGYLDALPTGLKNDEISGALNAKVMMETGRHLSGMPWWQALLFTGRGYPMAELHSFLVMPGIWIFGTTLLGARLMVAIFGGLTVVPIYLLTKNLVSRNTGRCVALILAINPWHIYISRSGFEAAIALFWYVLGLAIWSTRKGKSMEIVGAICLMVAFHAYQGMKIVVPLTVLVWMAWEWRRFKKAYWPKLLVLVWIMVYAPFFWLWSEQSARVKELSFDRQSDLEIQVAQLRSYSGLPRELDVVMFNKVTLSVWDYAAKFLGLFSPARLFTGGEDEPGFVLWRHGLFYLYDLALLCVGTIILLQKNRRLFYLLSGLIVVMALPAVLSRVGISYMFRASATIVIFSIIGGIGLYEIKSWLDRKTKRWRFAGSSIIVLSVSYFVVMYVGLMGAWGSQWFGFGERTMSGYVQRLGETEKIKVISNDPRNDYLAFAFYNNLAGAEIREAVEKQIYTYRNVRFVNDCPDAETAEILIIDAIKEQCGRERSDALIESQRRFQIYGDKVCTNAKSENYYRADWSPQNLSNYDESEISEFCEDWFFRPI